MSERDESKFKTKTGDCWVTDLEVLQSGGGFYIGRMCWSEDCDGLEEPYSRESGYYPTREAAQADLDGASFTVRNCMENDLACEAGVLPTPKTTGGKLYPECGVCGKLERFCDCGKAST